LAKILLFNPPGPQGKGYTREGRCTQEAGVWSVQWPPVSLASAAKLLEKDGHAVKIVDFPANGSDLSSMKEIVEGYQPDIAIWNTGTPTLHFDLSIARTIKALAPEAITCVMGTHVTAHPEEALDYSAVDIVIRKEPEQIIRNLCRSDRREFRSIRGISYRGGKGGKVYHNPDEGFFRPEDIPSPAWQYLDISPYRLPLKGRPFLIVAPIRGCPYACNFCTAPIYYGKRLRKRPVPNVMDEIERDIARFQVRDFFIWADTFTVDKGYVRKFSNEIIKRGLDISWTCNSRVDTVDEETLRIMKDAGLWMISFGLESGNNDILRATGKNISVEQSIQAVLMANRLGIKVSGHFIFGLPGETERTMEQTLRLSLDLPLDIAQFYSAAPFPGTGLYREALKNGWLKQDSGFSQSHAVMDLPGLPAREVDRFRKYAYMRFYLRSEALLRLVSMAERDTIRNIITNLSRFIKWVKG